MTGKEIDNLIIKMNSVTDKILSSPEKADKFLVATGIYDTDGNLTEPYK